MWVVAFGVVAVVVCYFVAVFCAVGGGVAARGGSLFPKKWNGSVLPTQSLRKNISRCGCGIWGARWVSVNLQKCDFWGAKSLQKWEMLDKWGNFVIILWHGEIVWLGVLAWQVVGSN